MTKTGQKMLPISRLAHALPALWVFALYWPVRNAPPVFDSAPQFGPLALYKGALANFSLWQPRVLTFLSIALVRALCGGDIFWQHLFNISLHALNAVLLFILANRLLTRAAPETRPSVARFAALVAALVFASTPAAVYATAYLIQRSLLMATACALAACLSLDAARKARRNSVRILYGVFSILFYHLALHAKETVLPAPAVIFLFARFFPPRDAIPLKRLWWVFAGFAVLALEITARQSGLLAAVYEPQAAVYFAPAGERLVSDLFAGLDRALVYPLSLINQAFFFGVYLYFWFIPDIGHMAIDLHYAFPTRFWSWPESLGPPFYLAWGLAGALLIRRRGRSRAAGFALLWPWLAFFTEFATVRVAESFALYRSYWWMAGASLLPALLWGWVSERVPRQAAGARTFAYALPVCYALVLGGAARERLATFSSEIAVWRDAVAKLAPGHEKHPGAYRPYYSLAYELILAGRAEEALPVLDRAIAIMPNDHPPRFNRGLAFEKLGRLDEAVANYEKALELKPDYPDAYNNLGGAYVKKGELDKAIPYFREAIRRWPAFAKPYNNLAVALDKAGRTEEALPYYREGARLEPEFLGGQINLAAALRKLGRHGEALSLLDNLLSTHPDHVPAVLQTGHVRYAMKDYTAAENDFRRALSLDPASFEAAFHLGNARARQNRLEEALEAYGKACELDPKNARAPFNRASVLEKLGRREEAEKYFELSKQIDPGIFAK